MSSLLSGLWLYLWLVFLFCWFSFLVGFPFQLVFLFGWFSFLVGFSFQLVFLFGWFSFLAGFPFQSVSFSGWFSFFIWFSFFSLSRRAKSSHLYAEPSRRGCRKALPTSSPGRHCQNKNFLECQGRRKRGLTSHKQTFRHSY